ncbi:MAG: hypothetical protein CM15mP18_0610 [Methanobacteriota archaeon]|nr:MAG: hypothetical protein CM15mP18_0610 [Euryarchaeota archaeon]
MGKPPFSHRGGGFQWGGGAHGKPFRNGPQGSSFCSWLRPCWRSPKPPKPTPAWPGDVLKAQGLAPCLPPRRKSPNPRGKTWATSTPRGGAGRPIPGHPGKGVLDASTFPGGRFGWGPSKPARRGPRGRRGTITGFRASGTPPGTSPSPCAPRRERQGELHRNPKRWARETVYAIFPFPGDPVQKGGFKVAPSRPKPPNSTSWALFWGPTSTTPLFPGPPSHPARGLNVTPTEGPDPGDAARLRSDNVASPPFSTITTTRKVAGPKSGGGTSGGPGRFDRAQAPTRPGYFPGFPFPPGTGRARGENGPVDPRVFLPKPGDDQCGPQRKTRHPNDRGRVRELLRPARTTFGQDLGVLGGPFGKSGNPTASTCPNPFHHHQRPELGPWWGRFGERG